MYNMQNKLLFIVVVYCSSAVSFFYIWPAACEQIFHNYLILHRIK